MVTPVNGTGTVSDKFAFPWPIFKLVLEGTSILDVPRLELRTMEEATSFIKAYGYDSNDPGDKELIWGFFEDAISFIEKSLADAQYPKIPEHLRSRKAVNDVRRLLLMASDRSMNPDQVYCCAILRVMHILIHVAHDPRLQYFDQVQNQILGRLDAHLSVDSATGATYLGKADQGEGIKLLFFKKKDRKDREREIIKLLHKSNNLVEEIYDRIGFRLVTETKYQAIRAVRLLLDKNIISVPNIRPGRSRNRLVDLSRLQFEIDRIDAHIKKSGESAPYIDKMIKRLESRIGFSRLGRSLMNPHSSEYYRAIQFTCRELVKIRNPLWQVYSKLKGPLENLHGGEQVLREVFSQEVPQYLYVFFPYEIQIMDVKAYADSIFGKSNHEEYRRKQLEAARDRVFGRSVGKPRKE
jgi:uncharacterized protein (TIGR04562 family)